MQKNQLVIVTAIIMNEGKLLLSRRNQLDAPQIHNKWQLIGGGIEFGEDPETAIIREVKEESDLVVRVKRLFPKVLTHIWEEKGQKDQIIILTYECEIISGIPNADADEETGELKYFSFAEIEQLDTLPNIKEISRLLFHEQNS